MSVVRSGPARYIHDVSPGEQSCIRGANGDVLPADNIGSSSIQSRHSVALGHSFDNDNSSSPSNARPSAVSACGFTIVYVPSDISDIEQGWQNKSLPLPERLRSSFLAGQEGSME